MPDPLIYPKISTLKEGQISIEVWLKPATEPNSSVPTVVTFYDAKNAEKLMIGQWKSTMLARIPISESENKKPYREIGARDAMVPGQVKFVTITSGKEGSTIYLDGKLARQARDFRILAENETLAGHRVYLGNSVDIVRPWSGDIFGFAIYGKALTETEVLQSFQQWTMSSNPSNIDNNGLIARYTFNRKSGTRISNAAGSANPLLIPPVLEFNKKILAPLQIFQADAGDVIINIIGFIPFGLVIALLLSKI